MSHRLVRVLRVTVTLCYNFMVTKARRVHPETRNHRWAEKIHTITKIEYYLFTRRTQCIRNVFFFSQIKLFGTFFFFL